MILNLLLFDVLTQLQVVVLVALIQFLLIFSLCIFPIIIVYVTSLPYFYSFTSCFFYTYFTLASALCIDGIYSIIYNNGSKASYYRQTLLRSAILQLRNYTFKFFDSFIKGLLNIFHIFNGFQLFYYYISKINHLNLITPIIISNIMMIPVAIFT